MKFRILPDNIQSVTTIFNSKTTSISPKDFNVDFARIDILDESIDEINYCINDAIYEGNFSIMLDGFISTETTEILKENGYKVNESDTHFQVIW